MYLGVDIGGTKTIAALLDKQGKIVQHSRFDTDQDYDRFLAALKNAVSQLYLPPDFSCVAAIPGLLDRQTGVVKALGNLNWRDKPIRDDIAAIVGQSVLIENDSRLAALSEAILLRNDYERVLYATISTGIGGGFVINGRIVRELEDMEMGKMPLLHGGKYVAWEDFASGRAIVERLGKMAEDIKDPAEWQAVAEPIAYGLAAVCSVLQPEVIVLGGGVGAFTDHFKEYIKTFLADNLHPVVKQPRDVLAAKRPGEAVIYGCYELARQSYP